MNSVPEPREAHTGVAVLRKKVLRLMGVPLAQPPPPPSSAPKDPAAPSSSPVSYSLRTRQRVLCPSANFLTFATRCVPSPCRPGQWLLLAPSVQYTLPRDRSALGTIATKIVTVLLSSWKSCAAEIYCGPRHAFTPFPLPTPLVPYFFFSPSPSRPAANGTGQTCTNFLGVTRRVDVVNSLRSYDVARFLGLSATRLYGWTRDLRGVPISELRIWHNRDGTLVPSSWRIFI